MFDNEFGLIFKMIVYKSVYFLLLFLVASSYQNGKLQNYFPSKTKSEMHVNL